MKDSNLFAIFLGAIFVNNFVLMRFLGLCPFLGVSKKIKTAVGMALAVTFVMVLSAVVTWIVQHYILDYYHIEYLRTAAFILVIASLVQLVEMVTQKTSPILYRALGIYLPLITTNCAVLGVSILNINEELSLVQTVVHSIGAACGFGLALLLMAGIRERLELADVPQSFKDVPIAMITAGFMAMAFMGFSGMM